MIESAEDGQGREPAERAKRAVRHDLAKIAQELDVLLAVQARDDLVHRLGAARRADTAGRAFAAAFLGAELEGETRLARHVDAIVEDDDPAVAQHAPGRGHSFVVERRVEQAFRKIGAQRAADLNGADRAAGPRAPAEAFDELADRRAERQFNETAVTNIAG